MKLLGRFDPSTNTIDPSQAEAFGPEEQEEQEQEERRSLHSKTRQAADEEGGGEGVQEGQVAEGGAEARGGEKIGVLVKEIKVDGEVYWQQVGHGLVFEFAPPYAYVGLLRKNGTIHYGQQPPGPTDWPAQIPKHMRPGRPCFVIGALNGSVTAARAYNRELHQGAWKDLHEYGLYKFVEDGRNVGYPWYVEQGQSGQDAARDRDGGAAAAAVGLLPEEMGVGHGRSARARELQSVASESKDLVKRRRRRREFALTALEREAGLEQQVVDGLWEMGQTEREFPALYKSVGDDVVKVPREYHPLWAKGACRCQHCDDMRAGVTGITCHCEHCYIQGYWKKKDFVSLMHLL
jgi:hypothetical protein